MSGETDRMSRKWLAERAFRCDSSAGSRGALGQCYAQSAMGLGRGRWSS